MNANSIIKNANVITMDESRPRADCFATYKNKFIDVAKNDSLDELKGPDTEVVDLDGKTVIPGFYDAHCHLSIVADNHLKIDLSPDEVDSISEIVSKIERQAGETPSGNWIQGVRYDETKLAEQRHPTRWDLDEASSEHPILILHSGIHQAVVNSKALEVAGWDEELPEFGSNEEFIEQDPKTGEPNGIIREDAKDAIIGGRNVEGIIPDPTREEEQEALRQACEKYNSFGITSIADMSGWPSALRLFMDGFKQDHLTVRVNTVLRSPYWEKLNDLHFRTDLGDNLLKIGPIKATADGAISSRTAYLSEPYNGDPDDYGDLRMTQDELDEFVLAGHKAGWQVAVHANGDATIEMVLDAFEKALQKHPREDHRHRIEHCTVVNEDILRRIKELNLVVNPFSTYLYQHGEKMVDYGERASMMFAHGSFLKHNIPVSGTTDNPAGLLNPLLGIQTMVTRKTNEGDVIGSEQRISVEEALRIYTMGSAYSRFEEQSKGSITPGKLADFVVLSANPTTVDPSSISDINVERTYMGGDCVYSTN